MEKFSLLQGCYVQLTDFILRHCVVFLVNVYVYSSLGRFFLYLVHIYFYIKHFQTIRAFSQSTRSFSLHVPVSRFVVAIVIKLIDVLFSSRGSVSPVVSPYRFRPFACVVLLLFSLMSFPRPCRLILDAGLVSVGPPSGIGMIFARRVDPVLRNLGVLFAVSGPMNGRGCFNGRLRSRPKRSLMAQRILLRLLKRALRMRLRMAPNRNIRMPRLRAKPGQRIMLHPGMSKVYRPP